MNPNDNIYRAALPDDKDPKVSHIITGSQAALEIVKLGHDARHHCQRLQAALQVSSEELGKALPALLQEQIKSEGLQRDLDRLRDGIRTSAIALEEPGNTSDTVWFNAHTTLLEHLQWLLDPGPKARGERPLLEEPA